MYNNDPFKYQRDVSFFLRLHRHLPDMVCGGSPISQCEYREDGEAINAANDYVEKLQENPDFVRKEKEVEEAQRNGGSIKKANTPYGGVSIYKKFFDGREEHTGKKKKTSPLPR